MAEKLAEAIVEIKAKIDAFLRDMKKVENAAKDTAKKTEGFFSNLDIGLKLGAVKAASSEFKKISEGALKIAEGFNTGSIAAENLGTEVVKLIPILGDVVEGFENLGKMWAAIESGPNIAERLSPLLDARAKASGELELAGLRGSARDTRAAELSGQAEQRSIGKLGNKPGISNVELGQIDAIQNIIRQTIEAKKLEIVEKDLLEAEKKRVQEAKELLDSQKKVTDELEKQAEAARKAFVARQEAGIARQGIMAGIDADTQEALGNELQAKIMRIQQKASEDRSSVIQQGARSGRADSLIEEDVGKVGIGMRAQIGKARQDAIDEAQKNLSDAQDKANIAIPIDKRAAGPSELRFGAQVNTNTIDQKQLDELKNLNNTIIPGLMNKLQALLGD